jgi:hypothetical protein
MECLTTIAADSMVSRSSVSSLSVRLGQQLFPWRPAQLLQHELVGSCAGRIMLPVSRGDAGAGASARRPPNAWIRFVFGTEAELQDGWRRISAAMFEWYGIPHASLGGHAFVREHFVTDSLAPSATPAGSTTEGSGVRSEEASLGFDLRVPEGRGRWTAAEFLGHILSVPTNGTDTLVLAWGRSVEFEELKPLQHAVAGEWTKGGIDTRLPEYRLVWKSTNEHGEYRGVAALSQENGGARVYVGCETADCYEMPLHNLLPSLPHIFNLFRSIPIERSDSLA